MRTPGPCPSDVALSRAFTVGADLVVRAHLEGCSRCQAVWRACEELRAAARELPAPRLMDASRERVRAAVLAEGARMVRPPRRRWPVVLGLSAAAAAALVLVLRAPAPPSGVGQRAPAHNAVVTSAGQARFRWVGERPDEVVRLEEGTISVEVSRLPPGERFRVRTGDGEVEVRGTGFDVRAAGDRLAAVRVRHGRVEVRPAGRPVEALGAGESWLLGEEPLVAASLPVPPPARAQAPAPSRRPAPAHRLADARPEPPAIASAAPTPAARTNPAEDHFRAAWAALKVDDGARAEEELEKAAAAPGADAIIEDIRFWRGVVLQRQGRQEEAARAFGEFLARHPSSPRAGEASVALGWSLLALGRREAARERFEAAIDDRAARVRESARAGSTASRAVGDRPSNR